ncbi:MAG TPA: serine hydrolase [Solirubrobacterales bacterium]|nr:serine hydrolase [Solirubrobacterales bacterium]
MPILVSALLACVVATAAGLPAMGGARVARPNKPKPPRWHPHVAEARRYADRRAGDVAFAVIDPRGRMQGLHKARAAPAASVFKAMLLVAHLRKRHDSGLSARDRALLDPMIRRSDNVAASTVRDLVGSRRIERLARVAHMRDFRYHPVWGQSLTSPRDQVRFMHRLMSYVPGQHRPYARYLLSHIVREQRWGIARVKPRGWRLFFKGGWGSGTGLVDHQVALLKRKRRRVAIAVFTELNPSHGYGKRTLRGVSARLLAGLGR